MNEVTVQSVIDVLEQYARPALALPGDPIGLCLGRREAVLGGVAVALDLTSAVIEKAIAVSAGLIVTHHPPIFQPLAALTADTPEGENVLTCAENGVALYAAHTNADACVGGTADLLAGVLFPDSRGTPLQAAAAGQAGEGLGRLLAVPGTTSGRVLERCREWLQAPFARLHGVPGRTVRRVAVWPGAMDESVVLAAGEQRADVLIAGECKHHLTLQLAERGIDLITAGHDRTEIAFVEHVAALLRARFSGLAVEAMPD